MSQNVNLQVAGIWTAPSDLAGIPQGSLDVGMNIENRYKNLIESRRGFDEISASAIPVLTINRMINFPILGTSRIVSLDSAGALWYYTGSAQAALPGLNSGVLKSDDLAKPRFIRGGQNLYLTGNDGVLSMASGSGSNMINAGVPVGLNTTPTLLATGSGFLSDNNYVAYRFVFGRTETDINGNTITRLGAPSSMAIVHNGSGASQNVSVVGTIPKNSSTSLTFYQLYRSAQGTTTPPLDQMQLVYEADLTGTDFTNRIVTVTDSVTDAIRATGAALYTGTDQEGILQANNPPPSCWDMAVFRDFSLFGNLTKPSTLVFSILAVGPASGVQVDDTITIAITGGASSVYTGKNAESAVAKQFKIFTLGTAAQNIADTAASLINVINYDQSLAVHAIYTSVPDGTPGQITLEGDSPQTTYTITASAHTTAYDPTLSNVSSTPNKVPNGVSVSKSGELESVPPSNLLYVGDSSSPIYRIIPLRDYAFVLKSDGIYKIIGTSPSSLTVLPFDLTTRIIGPDTAVSLNSGVYMLSNQGVIVASDAGVNGISIPVDDQLNTLIGSIYDNLNETSFAVGYESDRKYILFVPENSAETSGTLQYNYNYVTSSWLNWDRNINSAFINSDDNKIYISRADEDNKNISKERKSGTYQDYVDEGVSASISSVTSTTIVVLASVTGVSVGDILYQSGSVLSPITAIDLLTNAVTTQFSMSWTVAAATVYPAISCTITWKQVFGDNPAFEHQFSEGLALFKNTRFNQATMNFATDNSQNTDTVDLQGTLLGSWGLFSWGDDNWGGSTAPSSIRFLIPQDKQLGSYLIPSLNINQGWSNFKLQGLSISFSNVSQEVGK